MNKITIEKYINNGPGGGVRYSLKRVAGPDGDIEEINDLTFNELVQLTADLFTFVNLNK